MQEYHAHLHVPLSIMLSYVRVICMHRIVLVSMQGNSATVYLNKHTHRNQVFIYV